MATKSRILLVDDEPEFTSVWQKRLSSSGYEVSTATDGAQALDQIKANVPDIIIADVLMPRLDGFALCKELKKDRMTSDIPILIITGRNKMVDSFSVLGIDDYLIKPFDSETLLGKVENLLAQKQSPRVATDFAGSFQINRQPQTPHWGIILLGVFLFFVVVSVGFLIYSMVVTPKHVDLTSPGVTQGTLP